MATRDQTRAILPHHYHRARWQRQMLIIYVLPCSAQVCDLMYGAVRRQRAADGLSAVSSVPSRPLARWREVATARALLLVTQHAARSAPAHACRRACRPGQRLLAHALGPGRACRAEGLALGPVLGDRRVPLCYVVI